MNVESPQNEQAPDDLSQSPGEDEATFMTEQKPDTTRASLVLLGVVLLAGCVAFFLYKRGGPNSADAATVAKTEAAQQTITQFLSGGEMSVKHIEELVANTEKVVQQFKSYPSMAQVPIAELRANPFRHESLRGGEGGFEDSDAAKRREEQRLGMLKAAQGLQLQSLLHSGTRKTCMINNTLYQEGQQVEGFTIEKINPGSVIVRNGSYRFLLNMQR